MKYVLKCLVYGLLTGLIVTAFVMALTEQTNWALSLSLFWKMAIVSAVSYALTDGIERWSHKV